MTEYTSIERPQGRPDKYRFTTAQEFRELHDSLMEATEQAFKELDEAKRKSIVRVLNDQTRMVCYC